MSLISAKGDTGVSMLEEFGSVKTSPLKSKTRLVFKKKNLVGGNVHSFVVHEKKKEKDDNRDQNRPDGYRDHHFNQRKTFFKKCHFVFLPHCQFFPFCHAKQRIYTVLFL